ncbi:DUF1905 domain-containing protein [Pedobacter changchengzhani]|uniref:DUF1905 domain-containing protein n=1 Tax=Pedobacter changchengzhani TaxID=2529274 RepID=A0A4R5MLP7_9SPHI|nr:YdeI/OmpD-associated family protein [Pedobacter changchengzhani]TDG36614.1 DUF1905 domain-containing protein [Pedobacter changchengzhani]
MISFKAEIEKFGQAGEKTGWSYVFIPSALANQLKKDCKKSFRVKGKIDALEVAGLATTPMGNGDFILALKTELRKKLRKEAGGSLLLFLEEDINFKIEMPDDLEICLREESHLMQNFIGQPKSYQNYYINWINQAKTETTRTKRIVMTVIAMDKKQDFGTMMRESKEKL